MGQTNTQSHSQQGFENRFRDNTSAPLPSPGCSKGARLPVLPYRLALVQVRAVETSIDLCFRLKQEVGSFALMDDAGFKHMDFLQCCKFAEGDSRILMQKMARDRLKVQ